MTKPTKEHLINLKAAIQKEHDELPNYSIFGTENDKEGMLGRIKLVDWCIEHLNDIKALKDKVQEFDRKTWALDGILYDRFTEHMEVIFFTLGENDSYYKNMTGEKFP